MIDEELSSNSAFARMRKELKEAKGRLAEFEAKEQVDQRVRTAYFVAKEWGLHQSLVPILLRFAREQDGDITPLARSLTIYEIATRATPTEHANLPAAFDRLYEQASAEGWADEIANTLDGMMRDAAEKAGTADE